MRSIFPPETIATIGPGATLPVSGTASGGAPTPSALHRPSSAIRRTARRPHSRTTPPALAPPDRAAPLDPVAPGGAREADLASLAALLEQSPVDAQPGQLDLSDLINHHTGSEGPP